MSVVSTQWGQIMHIDGLVQDCSNSSVLVMELWQSCAKPLIYASVYYTFTGSDNALLPVWHKPSSELCAGFLLDRS